QERADTQAAYEAKYTPGVRSVDYRGYSLSPQGFAELAKMKKLESLNLSETPADDAAMKSLQGLRDLGVLVLSRTKLTDEGVKRIAGLPLSVLDLGHTNISNKSLDILARRTPKLEGLFVAGTEIDDEGMAPLSSLENLNHLDLTQTKITDKGLQSLSHLTN